MLLPRKNKMVEMEMCSRLRLGGKWYFPGDRIELDEADAEVYKQRGFARPVLAKQAPASGEKEMMSPQQIGIQTKELSQPPAVEVAKSAEKQPVVDEVTKEAQHGRHYRNSRKGR